MERYVQLLCLTFIQEILHSPKISSDLQTRTISGLKSFLKG